MLKRFLWYFTNIICFNSGFPINGVKLFLLRLYGAKVGRGVVIKPRVSIKYPWKLKVGDYTWIGEKVWIDNIAEVSIGKNVCISQGAMLLCGNHHYGKSTFDLIVRDITLEDGVWIGAKAIVCPGVIGASHAVLSVGSVASDNLQAYKIYRGNPAVIIRDRIIR